MRYRMRKKKNLQQLNRDLKQTDLSDAELEKIVGGFTKQQKIEIGVGVGLGVAGLLCVRGYNAWEHLYEKPIFAKEIGTEITNHKEISQVEKTKLQKSLATHKQTLTEAETGHIKTLNGQIDGLTIEKLDQQAEGLQQQITNHKEISQVEKTKGLYQLFDYLKLLTQAFMVLSCSLGLGLLNRHSHSLRNNPKCSFGTPLNFLI